MSKTFTLEEIQKHNNTASTWLIIRDKVYDVTKFLEEHPGGSEIILDTAGKDATRQFDDTGHSNGAIKQLDDFYIGDFANAKSNNSTNTTTNNNNNSTTITATTSRGAKIEKSDGANKGTNVLFTLSVALIPILLIFLILFKDSILTQ
eukprot:TRINITY_DN1622_c0_g4_i2.p1 TRINITY_DN1622_c0_g4~~TRINITY_DN1622_c0_g4_i2.p1  ORF type:complete len:148 (-),score=70.84 TRINITY_DN1622_c0_g4_i2:65-508(-)